MADLYELLQSRADTLRGRPETWRDRMADRMRRVDWQDVAFQAIFWPHLLALLLIEVYVVGSMVGPPLSALADLLF